MSSSKTYSCTVCGYADLDEPPVDEHGSASFSICPCCGTEFGYDDASRSHEELRQLWVATGAPWFSKATLPPAGWDATNQLKTAGFLNLTMPSAE